VRDLLLPDGRADQALVKAIGLAELKADAVDGIAKIRGRRIRSEGMQDSPFMRRQIVRGPRREFAQHRRVVRLRLVDPPFALRRRGIRIESQHFVHQPEIPVIVQQSAVGGDFRIDPDPETHVALEFGRMHERVRGVGARPTGAVRRSGTLRHPRDGR
jgi:hypothetical protein